MKLYLIKQNIINDYGTYDSAVVAAESLDDAITIHPSEFVTHIKEGKWFGTYLKGGEYENDENELSCWVKFSEIGQIQTEYLGETNREKGVILASFNAG